MILPHKVHRILSDLINSPHKVRAHSGRSVLADVCRMGACNQREEVSGLICGCSPTLRWLCWFWD